MRRPTLAAALALLAVLACTSIDEPWVTDDASTNAEEDGGPPLRDAATETDGGTEPGDAGPRFEEDGGAAEPEESDESEPGQPAGCGDGRCLGEGCASCPADCGACPPPAGCGDGQACRPGESCLVEGSRAYCSACVPSVCVGRGGACCPSDAEGCTDTLKDRRNCGGCGVRCGEDELCRQGRCEHIDALRKCPADPMQWWSSPQARDQRDVTFVAFGDPQAAAFGAGCAQAGPYRGDQTELVRDAINTLVPAPGRPNRTWPAGKAFAREGRPFDHVRGVIVAGDLTEAGDEARPSGAGRCPEYRIYRDAMGRCGDEGRLAFPTYEGYGNHDFPWVAGAGDPAFHPVISRLDAMTSSHRPGAPDDLYDDTEPGTGHYAWRWDDIWFVQLNLKFGFNRETIPKDGNTRIADPHGSRGFLERFLESRSPSTRRQVVVIAHYPLTSARVDVEERAALCRLVDAAQRGTGAFARPRLAPQWPLVLLHGHTHSVPRRHDFSCAPPYAHITIPQFDLGTPFYAKDTNRDRVHFSVMRIGNRALEVVGVGVDKADPLGPWTTTFTDRLVVMNPP